MCKYCNGPPFACCTQALLIVNTEIVVSVMRCNLVVHADRFLDLEVNGAGASRHEAAIGITVVLSKKNVDEIKKKVQASACIENCTDLIKGLKSNQP